MLASVGISQEMEFRDVYMLEMCCLKQAAHAPTRRPLGCNFLSLNGEIGGSSAVAACGSVLACCLGSGESSWKHVPKRVWKHSG